MVEEGKGLPSHCRPHAYLVQSALQTWCVLVSANRSQIKSIFPPITTQAPSSGVTCTRQLTKLKAQASRELHVRRFSYWGLWTASSVSATEARTAQNPQRRHSDTGLHASRAGQQERCPAPAHWYVPTPRPRADGTFHRPHPFSVHH